MSNHRQSVGPSYALMCFLTSSVLVLCLSQHVSAEDSPPPAPESNDPVADDDAGTGGAPFVPPEAEPQTPSANQPAAPASTAHGEVSTPAQRLRALRPSLAELRAMQEGTLQLREPRLTTKRGRHWFRGPLAAAYLAPLVGASVFALGAHSDSYFLPAVIGLPGLSAPPLVHSANADSSGALHALLGMLASAGTGALAGYTIGHIAPGGAARGQVATRDALMLGIVGYAIWALLDIAFFAYHDEPG